ncbi:uncharacterized protein LOC142598406 [Balearica regulorum gibbericeps]|uniref:uncharacterized protein LOC142598406 n=1 Tax=Balearica regulorum gibbericeps TaxID=100784 RepID=UPI003F61DEEA
MGTSWVMVLAPRGAPQGPPGPVCAVGNTTGPVLVSWPGGPRRVLGLGGGTGPLVSPMGTATGTGGLCQVRFNASGPPIQRSTELFRAAGSCKTLNSWHLAGVGIMVLLLLLFNICLTIWYHCRTTPMGHQPGTTEPPAPREDEVRPCGPRVPPGWAGREAVSLCRGRAQPRCCPAGGEIGAARVALMPSSPTGKAAVRPDEVRCLSQAHALTRSRTR